LFPRARTEGRADRQTDREIYTTKLIVTFGNFVNAPKISLFILPKLFKLTLLLSSLQSLALNHVHYI